MTRGRRIGWLFAAVGLMLGACSGDDSSPTGSGGSSASGGGGGAGGSSDTGGAAGSTSGGSAGTGGEAGSGDSGAADAASDAPPTTEGGRCLAAGTLPVVNEASTGYRINGGSLNAPLTLCRGNTYTFAINAPGHPFYVRQQTGTTFTSGITGNHIETGNLVFAVPQDAPDMLFYQCDYHELMTGAILIVD